MMGIFKISGKKGFTLMELLIVIAIIGILSAVAFPMITATLPKYRLRAAARELVIDFKKAKIEAVKRNRSVLLQFTLETVGNPDAGGSYLFFVDEDGNGNFNAGDTTLKTVTMPRDVRLSARDLPLPNFANARAGYNNRGLSLGNANGAGIIIQTSGATRRYTLTIYTSGGVRLE